MIRMSSAKRVLMALLLLIPTLRMAWSNREMPNFGRVHDDGVLFVSAKGLASTGEYRIWSLPETPAQTKYPVLYPLFLSLIWKVNPNFPSNLTLANLFCAITLLAALALAWLYYRGQNWPEWRLWVTFGLLAANPWMQMIGLSLVSETFFLCFALAAMIVIEKPGMRMAMLAGVLAGCAYLTRTAGLALLVSVPAVLLWKRERARAGAFAGAMLPFVLGWMAWTHANMVPSTDPMLTYYTSYTGNWRDNVGLDNIAVIIWKNLDVFLSTVGSLVLPNVSTGILTKMLQQALAVGVVIGIVRMARRGVALHFAVFSLLSTVLLLVWISSGEKLVMPMLALFIAGAVEEAIHLCKLLASALRHRDRSQRITAGALACFAGGLAIFSISMQVWLSAIYLPSSIPKRPRDLETAAHWLKASTPSEARILTGDDPLVYLYSGRQGHDLPFMYRWIYADDGEKFVESYRNLTSYCASRGMGYVLVSGDLGLARQAPEAERARIIAGLAKNPSLKPVFHTGGVSIYKVEIGASNHTDALPSVAPKSAGFVQ